MTDLDAAQEQLLEFASRLAEIQDSLRSLAASLPPSGDDLEVQDAPSEIRSVIDCVLVDSIGPAIRDLRAAAAFARKHQEEASSEEDE